MLPKMKFSRKVGVGFRFGKILVVAKTKEARLVGGGGTVVGALVVKLLMILANSKMVLNRNQQSVMNSALW